MKKAYFVALLLGFSILGADLASADIIVDTGTSGIFDENTGISTLRETQYLAGQFTLTQDITLSSVEGFFGGNRAHVQTLTTAIYTNSGNLPGVELYSKQFATAPGDLGGWFGTFDNSWSLSAGTYWVSMEIRPGDDFYYGSMPNNAVEPMQLEAWKRSVFGSMEWSAFNLGGASGPAFRLSSPDQAPVPEPATMLLFGTGLSGLALFGRRKKA